MAFKSAEALVEHWTQPGTGIIALAHEFKDGSIFNRDGLPCHRAFNITDFTAYGQKRENLTGAYVKLSYKHEAGYSYGATYGEVSGIEYDKVCEAWYDFIVSDDSPWRGVKKTLLKDKNGKYRALHIPDIQNQQMQYWIQMCFSTRAAPQRHQAMQFWYDMVHKWGFHPTEAMYIMSGIMYSGDYKNIQFNPLCYDWVFKSYKKFQSSFYRLWNAKPNILAPGFLHSIKPGTAKQLEPGSELYGMPNDIWVEDDSERRKATDFCKILSVNEERYQGEFPKFFKAFTNSDKFPQGLPKTEVAIGQLKEMVKTWPR